MKKRILDDYPTKAKKRQVKKRPRMRVHGRALKTEQAYAGRRLTSLRTAGKR